MNQAKFEGTIMIEGGDVFFGTQDQFRDCFFDNADLDNIRDWAKSHGWTVEFYDDPDPRSAFVKAVMKGVGLSVDLTMVDEEDIAFTIHSGIPQMFSEGFNVSDAVRYLLCVEHFNPDLDEEEALKRMKEIRDKYVR